MSDLDVIFAINGAPSKAGVYPPLVEHLRKEFNVSANIGSGYNVIKIRKKQLSCDLVLLTESEFQDQLNRFHYEEI